MLSAVMVGMVGFHLLKHLGYVQAHAAEGSVGSNVIGGLIFGVSFALLGYCPGTVAGAVGTGAIDALLGGMVGPCSSVQASLQSCIPKYDRAFS